MREDDLGPKSAGYARALRRWTGFLIREPDALLAGSALFLLTALPLVTLGPALLALHYYMRAREEGVRRTWRDACRHAFLRCGARSWLMGATDVFALVMAGGCLLGVLGLPADFSTAPPAPPPMLPLPLRAVYAALFALDLLYFLSGIYRYPALIDAPEAGFIKTASRGFLLAVGDLGWFLMFTFASLLALIVCALTGVGIFLVFPAASAALAGCAYDEMSAYYTSAR
jgi:hypothetical protein